MSALTEAIVYWAQWAPKLRAAKAVQHNRHKEISKTQQQITPTWDHVKTLVTWDRAFTASAPTSLPSWNAASSLFTSFILMSQSAKTRLTELYEASKLRLSPLSDPLDVRFPLHKQLAPEREEVYSDWLKWVFDHLSEHPRLIAEILGFPDPVNFGSSSDPIEVKREETVPRGHQDRAGRLDLVIHQGEKWLAVIEVKTKPHSKGDVEKHTGYRDSAALLQHTHADLIFLAADPPDSDSSGFRFLSWADLCIAIRRIAPRLLEPKHIIGTALMLAFVGAVEQNLLGFASLNLHPSHLTRFRGWLST
jgi:hypothetical protein